MFCWICLYLCMIFICWLLLYGVSCSSQMEHSGESTPTSSGGRKPRKKGYPNHRWTSEESRALINFLVEQVHLGMKVPKSFKPTVFQAAAKHISNIFKVNVTQMHVKNHYRVLKSRLRDIRKAIAVSGAGWDNINKVVTFEKETVDASFQVWLNVHESKLLTTLFKEALTVDAFFRTRRT